MNNRQNIPLNINTENEQRNIHNEPNSTPDENMNTDKEFLPEHSTVDLGTKTKNRENEVHTLSEINKIIDNHVVKANSVISDLINNDSKILAINIAQSILIELFNLNKLFQPTIVSRYYNDVYNIIDVQTLEKISRVCQIEPILTGTSNNGNLQLFTKSQKLFKLESVRFCNDLNCLKLKLENDNYVEELFFNRYCSNFETIGQYMYCKKYVQGFPNCQYSISTKRCRFEETQVTEKSRFLGNSGQYICNQTYCDFAANLGMNNLIIGNDTLEGLKISFIETIQHFEFHLDFEERNNLITKSETLTIFQKFSKSTKYSNYVIFTIILVAVTILFWIIKIIMCFHKLMNCKGGNVQTTSEYVRSVEVNTTSNAHRLQEFEIALLNN